MLSYTMANSFDLPTCCDAICYTKCSSFTDYCMSGADPGGLWDMETPFQIVLILKQPFQIIILIGTKIINLLYFKVPARAYLHPGLPGPVPWLI